MHHAVGSHQGARAWIRLTEFADPGASVTYFRAQPEENKVNLKVRVFEEGNLQFEENIRETIHDPAVICDLLRQAGFLVEKCADRLLEDSGRGTTWFVVAKKPSDP